MAADNAPWPDVRTLWCRRCEAHAPISEWEYRPKWHGWQHMLSIEANTTTGDLVVRPCGRLVKIPSKV